MFYLIICDADKSYCTVEDFEVIYDSNQPPEVDDHVQFFWGKEKYSGVIVDSSENDDVLNEKAKKLKSKRKLSTSSSQSPLPEKRPRKPKKCWSFTENSDNSEMGKPNKVTSNSKVPDDKYRYLQNQVKTAIQKNKSDEKENEGVSATDNSKKSPSREELKLMVELQQKLLASLQGSTSKKAEKPSRVNSKRCVSSDSDDSSHHEKSDETEVYDESNETINDKDDVKIDLPPTEDEKVDTEGNGSSNSQLYGKDCGEKTIMLKNNIYCKKSVYDDAVDLSRKSGTSFLRRLMDGVFKREELLKCTRTGRPPSAQGKLRQSEKVEPLDRVARNAVIDFSLDYAINQGWEVPTKGQLKSAMSQWIGEFKRAERKNRNRQT